MSQSPALRVLVLNGPNLNLLGERDPALYGTATLADVTDNVTRLAKELDVAVDFAQHNSEGDVVDALQRARHDYDAVILNPGPLSHSSLPVRDVVHVISTPVVEVHISNVVSRGGYHEKLVTAPAAAAVICGCGIYGYELALRLIVQRYAPAAAADRQA
ncbi:3-dehydroquinate dehydratase [Streptacidiphilus pinicola]|uniref:3-dehydroquinate dehydratase n=1 Tax=Streptacidiphilus pinicola TaxID=2219663 RepID=A0A2X0K3K4_9ACTN|nr:type II 3-dehydroquinate dehydratase [Streptacidiphilus pinicola]RAG81910.1 3-dehydroquinate dehydratase [Streptacidiphilus pinicola]